jgi:hypothetical protein
VGDVASAVRVGWFIPFPGAGAINCKSCDYANVCEARVSEQVELKARSGQLRALLDLPDFSPALETLPAAGSAAATPEDGEA